MQMTSKRSLEGYRLFPYLAWGLTIIFALFVYHLANEVQDVTAQLSTQGQTLEQQIMTSDVGTVDFTPTAN